MPIPDAAAVFRLACVRRPPDTLRAFLGLHGPAELHYENVRLPGYQVPAQRQVAELQLGKEFPFDNFRRVPWRHAVQRQDTDEYVIGVEDDVPCGFHAFEGDGDLSPEAEKWRLYGIQVGLNLYVVVRGDEVARQPALTHICGDQTQDRQASYLNTLFMPEPPLLIISGFFCSFTATCWQNAKQDDHTKPRTCTY